MANAFAGFALLLISAAAGALVIRLLQPRSIVRLGHGLQEHRAEAALTGESQAVANLPGAVDGKSALAGRRKSLLRLFKSQATGWDRYMLA